ncbi:MAG: hypothetical protein VX593_05800 [Pseudomonadota bacterium]|nr:hypothetical protein [Pseudomonadota bacterium]
MRVPVWHWRVLFHYLGRLGATFETARAEGRSWVTWHLREDGVIWVSAWEETEAEKRAKCALPAGFDRAPWRRVAVAAPLIEAAFQPECRQTVTRMFLEWFQNAAGPSFALARAPP